jgi:hypothetical protein
MKASPILFIVLGLLLIWLGANGTLGVALASLFAPHNIKLT